MDAKKIGKLIFDGRTKKGMTQSQLAEKINVSDKTVSKWECGNGCPDITLISSISKVLEIDISSLLSGELKKNRFSGVLKASVQDCGGEFYVQFEHEMTKENYISAVFAVYYDRGLSIPLFAEQEASFVVNQVSGVEFYAVDCNNNGFKFEISAAQ